MDTIVLGLHSLLRWLVLAGLAWALIRGTGGWRRGDAVTDRDRKRVEACIGLTNLQLLLGFALYLFFSPWLAAVRLDPAAAMRTEIVRFYGVEHPATMFVAIIVLHVTAGRFRQASVESAGGRTAWRRLSIGFGLATALILASIPWPFRWLGRPLLPFSSVLSTPTPTPVQTPPMPTPPTQPPAIVGPWHATLASRGGNLPFALSFAQDGDDGPLTAVIENGPERIAVSNVTWEGDELVLAFDRYGSEIRATGGGQSLAGRWTKTTAKGKASMRFSATRGDAPRFAGPVSMPRHTVPVSIDGDWSVVFTEADGTTSPAQGVFTTHGDRLEGTFLTDTGDYRYLQGRYTKGVLELSCFDGSHAFLFRAQIDAQGALQGEFWSGDAYHATWTGVPLGAQDPSPLPDPFGIVTATTADGRLPFSFPDLQGNPVRHDDPQFAGNVVLVELFGTWCPNCNDYAPLLAQWDAEYRDQGLRIVGLAFEMTGEVERDRTAVAKYAEHFGLHFPLLLAGTSDKAEAALAMPWLSKVAAYPTTVLVGRDGKVRTIHSGFAGPATGKHHTALVAELRTAIESLLAEPAPAPTSPAP